MDSPDVQSPFDMIVIGAGLSGLVAAARCLQAHPTSNLILLEQDSVLGGVWSQRRTYPSFWTQTALGLGRFADMSMPDIPPEDISHDLHRAKYSTQYLEDYADYIKISGRTLRSRIRFNTKVDSVTKPHDLWTISCTTPTSETTNNQETKTYTSSKLIVANGNASIPRIPTLPGRETFAGPIIHSLHFGQQSSLILSNPDIKHITVLGGGKSAADMVYEAVTSVPPKTVSWVIRDSGGDDGGTGPGFFAQPDAKTPYRSPGYAAQTRFMSMLQPCFMLDGSNWLTRFLHGTWLGVGIVKCVFGMVDRQMVERAGFETRGGGNGKGFEGLRFDTGVFWQNGFGGVVHHEDFYDLVAEKVWIHRARIKKLERNEIYLDDAAGTHFPCDAILCGTGWEKGLDMFSDELRMQLGLPYPKKLNVEIPKEAEKWERLVYEADRMVLERFPILRNPPPHHELVETKTPYRLYKGIAPLTDDSIVFINHTTVSNKILGAEGQAMWAVAYFDKNIKLPSIEDREKEVSTWIAWCKRRYLSNGQLGNYIAFDGVLYADSLLEEMGLTAHRRKGWWGNLFGTVMPEDLGAAWKEYLEKNGLGQPE